MKKTPTPRDRFGRVPGDRRDHPVLGDDPHESQKTQLLLITYPLQISILKFSPMTGLVLPPPKSGSGHRPPSKQSLSLPGTLVVPGTDRSPEHAPRTSPDEPKRPLPDEGDNEGGETLGTL